MIIHVHVYIRYILQYKLYFYRTENNRTPEQLWTDGVLTGTDTSAIRSLMADDSKSLDVQLVEALTQYGITPEDLDEPSTTVEELPRVEARVRSTIVDDDTWTLIEPILQQQLPMRTKFIQSITILEGREPSAE